MLGHQLESSQGGLRQTGGSTFSFKLTCNDKRFEDLISQCTGIKLIGQSEKETDGEKCVCLEFGIVFAPPKAFRQAPFDTFVLDLAPFVLIFIFPTQFNM